MDPPPCSPARYNPRFFPPTTATMFTGLVETIGSVLEFTQLDTTHSGGQGVSAVISAPEILADVNLGDSICTNGVCLTVTEFDPQRTWFKVGIAPETLRRSDLGGLRRGDRVNLERAVTSDVRMGGHVVQGHVDTVATITRKQPDGNAIAFTFQLRDRDNINYIVEKGFVAVDGTSLTVTGVDRAAARFSIMMVDYTQGKVVMPAKAEGASVNVEVDYTGKLLEAQIEAALEGQLARRDSPLVRFINAAVDRRLEALP